MTTANYNKGLNINNDLITALYCRLSVEDIKDENGKKKRNIDESNSISNQKQILSDYAKKHGYTNTMFFVDATDIIGLKQNPTNGRRFSPIFFVYRAFST